MYNIILITYESENYVIMDVLEKLEPLVRHMLTFEPAFIPYICDPPCGKGPDMDEGP